jgi:hypothetical protein
MPRRGRGGSMSRPGDALRLRPRLPYGAAVTLIWSNEIGVRDDATT